MKVTYETEFEGSVICLMQDHYYMDNANWQQNSDIITDLKNFVWTGPNLVCRIFKLMAHTYPLFMFYIKAVTDRDNTW